ncbi:MULTISPECIES: LysR substrate-binding domain-containing protein [unclassified Lysobacter]|uniref:LysR substrate-binding domain-containing protein n=1 Tax=unclassified Lysobacter TaxID=2635362 RepID=UPI0020352B35|nr:MULTISPECIES: LysR substrate-binding domain-containing protein [unclassified Lysobacter]
MRKQSRHGPSVRIRVAGPAAGNPGPARAISNRPAYLQAHGTPRDAAGLSEHNLLGFAPTATLNRWLLRDVHGNELDIAPRLHASSGETLRQLVLAGEDIVCLSDFMTREDRRRGDLVQLVASETLDARQPINAVYYRNTQLASRIACFLDFVAERLAPRGGEAAWE